MSAPYETDSTTWHVWVGRIALAAVVLLAVRDGRGRGRRKDGGRRAWSRRV